MLEIRTDLALEKCKDEKNSLGKTRNTVINGVNATYTEINAEEAKRLGKTAGRYVTADIGRIWESDAARFTAVGEAMAAIIRTFIKDINGCVLVAGLGNMGVTADSVGPRVTKKLLVTDHIKTLDPSLFNEVGFGDVAAVSPGVMGQTGIESSLLVISAAKCCGASLVIAIDSLASHSLSRLGTTFQITDTGISPGSGVFNTRGGITKESAGIPVIAIGVPMVVDAETLALDLLSDGKDTSDAEKLLSGRGKSLFITPKETDVIAEKTASLIAYALNRALHSNITPDEMAEYIR